MSTTTEPDNNYFLRVPTASSIYRVTPEDTLAVLHCANQSRPADKRFPTEILILINELNANPTYEKVRSTWVGVPHRIILDGIGFLSERGVFFDEKKGVYYPGTVEPWWADPANWERHEEFGGFKQEISLYRTVSSADLLYRLRCFFPEIYIETVGRHGYQTVWIAGIQHIPSGVNFMLSERKGAVEAYAIRGNHTTDMMNVGNNFIEDAAQLMNTFFETIDVNGARRLAYFHPSAEADYPTADECFLAVPKFTSNRVGESRRSYRPWNSRFPTVTVADFTTFKSLLPSMKYNITSRKVDTVDGSAELTTIISSSLLFYRLLCHFTWQKNNVSDTRPVTSVWQVKLRHAKGAFLLFMDDHGLFDIRAEENVKEVMSDIIDLVNALCSDQCCHPYDGTVAGCVA